jgi:hypothetical protein
VLFKRHVRKYGNKGDCEQPEEEGWVAETVTVGAVITRDIKKRRKSREGRK